MWQFNIRLVLQDLTSMVSLNYFNFASPPALWHTWKGVVWKGRGSLHWMGLICSIIPSTCSSHVGVWKPCRKHELFQDWTNFSNPAKGLSGPLFASSAWFGFFYPVQIRVLLGGAGGGMRPHLSQGLADYHLQARSGPLPVFVNKVLLEHSHAYLFMYCPRLLLCYQGGVEKLHRRPEGPPSRKHLLSFTQSLS